MGENQVDPNKVKVELFASTLADLAETKGAKLEDAQVLLNQMGDNEQRSKVIEQAAKKVVIDQFTDKLNTAEKQIKIDSVTGAMVDLLKNGGYKSEHIMEAVKAAGLNEVFARRRLEGGQKWEVKPRPSVGSVKATAGPGKIPNQ
jgi:hypothetical protein